MKKRTRTGAVVLAGMLGVTTVFPAGSVMNLAGTNQVVHAATTDILTSDNGECGDGVTYTFVSGVLTINGNGVIREEAFQGIEKITSVVISDGVTGIGRAAFSGCTELNNISIPDTVTTIESLAFENTKLTTLALPKNLTTMGAFILKDNSGVTSLTIPKGVTQMQENEGGYHGSLYDSAVEQVIFEEGIEKIPMQACQGAKKLTKVTLPNTVKTIESFAFEGTALTELNLPESVTEMGAFILDGNTAVKSLNVPKNVIVMQENEGGYHGSLYGSAVESVTFAEGREVVPDRACQGAKSLTKVTLPESVTTLGNSSFSECSALMEIVLPSKLNKIDSYSFEKTALKELNIPESVTEMGAFILDGNTAVKSLNVPKNVIVMQENEGGYHGSLYGSAVESVTFAEGREVVPDRACQGAKSLTKVTLPESVTTLGNSSFSECSALMEIVLPSKLNKIDSYSFEKTALKELSIPESVTEMGAFILNENKDVKSLTIPKNVTTMQANEGGYHGSLYGSAVETVLFAEGMLKLPNQACQGAANLTKATGPVSVVAVGDAAMEECPNVKIYCYSGSYIDEYALQNNIAYEYIGEAKDSVITAPNYTKTSSSSKQTFKIDTKLDGLGAFTYLSDKASVEVDQEGNVTIAPDFVGKATITIKVSSVGAYKAGEKKITVNVKPAATKISKLTNKKKNKMVVKWAKKSKVTGYQIQYSTDVKFKKSVKKVSVSGNKVSSKTISSLKKKKTYYVRIRTYKTVSGKTYYSDWSTAKKVKITK